MSSKKLTAIFNKNPEKFMHRDGMTYERTGSGSVAQYVPHNNGHQVFFYHFKLDNPHVIEKFIDDNVYKNVSRHVLKHHDVDEHKLKAAHQALLDMQGTPASLKELFGRKKRVGGRIDFSAEGKIRQKKEPALKIKRP